MVKVGSASYNAEGLLTLSRAYYKRQPILRYQLSVRLAGPADLPFARQPMS